MQGACVRHAESFDTPLAYSTCSIGHSNISLIVVYSQNTIKISYSCMPNMAARIKSHNKAVLCPQTKKPDKPCNCRDKPSCPLNGECQTTELIYVASITSGPTKKEYTGMSAPPFKSRHANHMTTTRYEKYSSSTEFSNYIWNLKKSNAQYDVEWRIKDRAQAYSNITKRCSLCTREKYHILNTLGHHPASTSALKWCPSADTRTSIS